MSAKKGNETGLRHKKETRRRKRSLRKIAVPAIRDGLRSGFNDGLECSVIEALVTRELQRKRVAVDSRGVGVWHDWDTRKLVARLTVKGIIHGKPVEARLIVMTRMPRRPQPAE